MKHLPKALLVLILTGLLSTPAEARGRSSSSMMRMYQSMMKAQQQQYQADLKMAQQIAAAKAAAEKRRLEALHHASQLAADKDKAEREARIVRNQEKSAEALRKKSETDNDAGRSKSGSSK